VQVGSDRRPQRYAFNQHDGMRSSTASPDTSCHRRILKGNGSLPPRARTRSASSIGRWPPPPGDPLGGQPLSQRLQPRGAGPEGPYLLGAATVSVVGAHAGHQLVLGDVQPGAARRQQHRRRHLPCRWVVPDRADRSGDAETPAHSNSSWCRKAPGRSFQRALLHQGKPSLAGPTDSDRGQRPAGRLRHSGTTPAGGPEVSLRSPLG
jgi:hypothetical protein